MVFMDYRKNLSELSKIVDDPVEGFQKYVNVLKVYEEKMTEIFQSFVDSLRAYEEKMIIRGRVYREGLSKLSEIIDNPIDSFQGFVDLSRDYNRKMDIRYRVYKRKRRLDMLKQESSLEHLRRDNIDLYRETLDIVKGIPSFVSWLTDFSYYLVFTNKRKEWADYLNKNVSNAM